MIDKVPSPSRRSRGAQIIRRASIPLLCSAKDRLRVKAPVYDRYDRTYVRFVQGCATAHEEIEQLLGRAVTPREVDKVLLAVADRN